VTIRELVEIITRLTGYEGSVTWDRTKPDGQPRRKLNVDRARAEFGFESAVGFEDGLRRTIAAYQSAISLRSV
jgi:nucleoside-diphosphate-sugar epimerase